MTAQYTGSQYSGTGGNTKERSNANTWRVNEIRIEAILSDEGLPEVVPGGEASYDLLLTDNTAGAVAPLEERYQELLGLLETSRRVDVYESTDSVYYRNQSNADQLVIIEPIASDAIAYQDDPETRASNWPGRYAIVTGGSDNSNFPDGNVQITLETVTIDYARNFASREDVADKRERSGI